MGPKALFDFVRQHTTLFEDTRIESLQTSFELSEDFVCVSSTPTTPAYTGIVSQNEMVLYTVMLMYLYGGCVTGN